MDYDLSWMLCLYHPHAPEGMIYFRNITTEELEQYNAGGHPIGEFSVSPVTYDRDFNLDNDPNKWALFVNAEDLSKHKIAVQVVSMHPQSKTLLDTITWVLLVVITGGLALVGAMTLLYLLLDGR